MATRFLELVKSAITPRPQPAQAPQATAAATAPKGAAPSAPTPATGSASSRLLQQVLSGLQQGSPAPRSSGVNTASGFERYKNGVSDYVKNHCKMSLQACAQVACKAPQHSSLSTDDIRSWDGSLQAFSSANSIPVDLVRYYAVQFTCQDPPPPPPPAPVTDKDMVVLQNPATWGNDDEFSSIGNAEPAWWTQVTAAGAAGAAAAWLGQKVVQGMAAVPAFRSATLLMSASLRYFEELHDPSRQIAVY